MIWCHPNDFRLKILLLNGGQYRFALHEHKNIQNHTEVLYLNRKVLKTKTR